MWWGNVRKGDAWGSVQECILGRQVFLTRICVTTFTERASAYTQLLSSSNSYVGRYVFRGNVCFPFMKAGFHGGVSARGACVWKVEGYILPPFVCVADIFVMGLFFLQSSTGKCVSSCQEFTLSSHSLALGQQV